jgi:putative transposase
MFLEPNKFYHIYNHAIGDDNLFRNNQNYLYFLKRYAHFIHPIAKTYAYCLMPNHFHLLVKIRSEEDISLAFPKFKTLEKLEMDRFISKQFANLFSSYTQSFNKVFKRRGSLFIKNFKRKPILNDAYFTSVLQYIHRNPQHHGFSTTVEDWRWSSYHSLISQKPTHLERQEIIGCYGTEAYFKESHKRYDALYFELSQDDFY